MSDKSNDIKTDEVTTEEDTKTLAETLEDQEPAEDIVWGPDTEEETVEKLDGDIPTVEGLKEKAMEEAMEKVATAEYTSEPEVEEAVVEPEPEPVEEPVDEELVSIPKEELEEMKELLKQSLVSEVPEPQVEVPVVEEPPRPTRGHQQKIFQDQPIKVGGGTVRTKPTDVTPKSSGTTRNTVAIDEARPTQPIGRLDKTVQGTIRTTSMTTKMTDNKATS